MSTLEVQIRKPLPVDSAIPTESQPLNARVLEPARRAGLGDLHVIGRSEQPPNGYPWRAPNGHWWAFFDHASDPTAEVYGGVVVPADIRARLERLLTAGFDPDVVLIGHEMPREWTPGEGLPSLLPKRPAAGRSVAITIARPGFDPALRFGGAVALVALNVGAGALRLAEAVARSVASLDPVVLAGVRHGDGSLTWVEVCRWNW